MRIALVSRELYPYVGGGIAPIAAAAARLLSDVAEVTVVTSGSYRERHAELSAARDPRLLPDDVRLLFVDEPEPEDIGAAYSYMHAYSARVHRALREAYGDRGPDLIEFGDYLGEGFVTVQDHHTSARWLRDTLVCVRIHTTSELCSVLDARMPDDFATTAMFEAERYVLRNADRVLWSGGDVLDTYRRFYGADALARAVRLPDAFRLEDGNTGDHGREAPTGERPLRLLYLGRMERRKGVHNLLSAAMSLGHSDWSLTLLGGDTDTGPVGTSLRSILELSTAEDPRVTFADPVSRGEVQDVIRRHDVVVVPSLWECWPNVAREALACNRPILATPVGGLTAMVQPGRSGWLARDTTPRALTDALDRLLSDRAEVDDLIAAGGPRQVFTELTDPQALVSGYRELVSSRTPTKTVRRAANRTVSVIVPYYRLDAYVEETLASVVAQTHPDIEIVVSNDGSLLETDSLLFDLADRYPIRVVTQPNSGLSAARNFGISQSRGAYVLPVDADDLLEPTFVERCLAALEGNPELAYATTWAEFMDERGERLPAELGGYMPFGNWSSLIRRNNVGGTCSAVIRRRVFERGFRYRHDLVSYEDWLLYWEMHEAGLYGAVAPERLFRYRVRDESMMRQEGAPLTGVLIDELRALAREHSMQWTAATA